MNTWHAAKSAGNSQGIVIDDETGANIAVAYDVKDTPLLAKAPEMRAAIGAALSLAQTHDPKTGFYAPVNPYELAKILRPAFYLEDLRA